MCRFFLVDFVIRSDWVRSFLWLKNRPLRNFSGWHDQRRMRTPPPSRIMFTYTIDYLVCNYPQCAPCCLLGPVFVTLCGGLSI